MEAIKILRLLRKGFKFYFYFTLMEFLLLMSKLTNGFIMLCLKNYSKNICL